MLNLNYSKITVETKDKEMIEFSQNANCMNKLLLLFHKYIKILNIQLPRRYP